MDNISWPYSVKFSADHPRRKEGHDRWAWLYKHVGDYTVDWNLIPAFDPGDTLIYLFKTESDCVRFALTWL
jgi:hypothetical protein